MARSLAQGHFEVSFERRLTELRGRQRLDHRDEFGKADFLARGWRSNTKILAPLAVALFDIVKEWNGRDLAWEDKSATERRYWRPYAQKSEWVTVSGASGLSDSPAMKGIKTRNEGFVGEKRRVSQTAPR